MVTPLKETQLKGVGGSLSGKNLMYLASKRLVELIIFLLETGLQYLSI